MPHGSQDWKILNSFELYLLYYLSDEINMDNSGKILYHGISYHHSVHVLKSFELVTLFFLYSEYNSFGQLFFPYIPGINTAVQTWGDD